MAAIPFLADCAIELDSTTSVGNEEEVVKIDHWSHLLWCLQIISFTISKCQCQYHFTHFTHYQYHFLHSEWTSNQYPAKAYPHHPILWDWQMLGRGWNRPCTHRGCFGKWYWCCRHGRPHRKHIPRDDLSWLHAEWDGYPPLLAITILLLLLSFFLPFFLPNVYFSSAHTRVVIGLSCRLNTLTRWTMRAEQNMW